MKLLLHSCCGPCATIPIKLLQEKYEVVMFFYNPNIYPDDEYNKRLESAKKVAEEYDVEFIEVKPNFEEWYKQIEPYKSQPEGGIRCDYCFKHRLEVTARFAIENGFEIFGTTLGISPYKNSRVISEIGNKLSDKYGVEFYDEDFSSYYKESITESKKLNLYRQKYCGCEYSMH